MEKLITFRLEMDSLSDGQFNQFLLSIGTHFGRDKVTRMLFDVLLEEFNNNQLDNIDKMNNQFHQLKQQNNSKHSDDDEGDEDIDIADDSEAITMKLDELPSIMIGEIASYLKVYERFIFEKVNRSTFIGSRSFKIPIHTLTDIIFNYLPYSHNQNNHQYISKLFKTFHIQRIKNNEFQNDWDYFYLFKNIQTLEIKYGYHHNLQSILSKLSECNDLSNIKRLSLYGNDKQFGFGNDHRLKSLANLISLIVAKMTNLEYFEYDAVSNEHNVICDDNGWMRKLKGIRIPMFFGNDHLLSMYPSIGVNLQSLHIHIGNTTIDVDNNYSNGKLKKLKEICLPSQQHESLMKWLEKHEMNELKRIHLGTQGFNEKVISLSFMKKAMKTVEYIGYNACHDELDCFLKVFNIIIKSLESMEKKKDKLKIRINELDLIEYFGLSERREFDLWWIRDAELLDEVRIKMEKLIDTLNLNCSNWMLICYNLKILANNESLDGLLEVMEKEYCVVIDKTTIEYLPDSDNREKVYQYEFVVSNHECGINGYHEQWHMECQECKQKPIFN